MAYFIDWISTSFMRFVFTIYSLVILYRDDHMFGNLNIIRFISLVLIFLVFHPEVLVTLRDGKH